MFGPRTRKPSPDIAAPSRFACPGTARLLRSKSHGRRQAGTGAGPCRV